MALAAAALPAGGSAHAQQAVNLDSPIMQFHSRPGVARAGNSPLFASPLRTMPLWRGDLEKARSAWRKGKYKKARKAFTRAWNNGNLVAAWYLGHIYRLGRGAKKNPQKAFFFYRQVALAYDPDDIDRKRLMMTVDALVRVAGYYRSGIGRKKARRDPRRAYRLYNIAAGHGHPAAYYGLGMMALRGEGMKKRPRRAINWLIKAARGGYADAALQLARISENGLKGVVRQDKAAALSWYLVASAHQRGKVDEKLLRHIDGIRNSLPEDARQRATRMARHFISRSSIPPRAFTMAK